MKYTIEKSNYSRGDSGRTMHKYVKRTGSPGNYKYWYKLPNGKLTTDNDDMQSQGKRDHARRLAIGHLKGIESKNLGSRAAEIKAEIARRTGLPVSGTGSVENIWRNLHKKRGGQRAFESADYEDAHLLEGHDNSTTEHPDDDQHKDHTARVRAEIDRRSAERRERHADGASDETQSPEVEVESVEDDPQNADGTLPEENVNQEALQNMRDRISQDQPQEESDEEIKNLLAQLKDSGFNLGDIGEGEGNSDSEAEQAADSAQRITDTQQAHEMLSEADPTYGEAEQEINEMDQDQREGSNPYLSRAMEVWESVKANYEASNTPTNSSRVSFMNKFTNFINDFDTTDKSAEEIRQGMISAGVVSSRKSLDGIDKDLGSATGFTLSEIGENAPVDPELERMKRGYGQKQFERMRNHIKDSWHQNNPDAPPPFPTFGDIKSWSEFGGDKPSWAGRTRLSMPEEVFNATPKEDGKPKYPPAWMPINHMPLWNYVVKKVGSDTAYQSPEGRGNISPISRGNADGVIINSIRKYIMRRGGAEGLINIPNKDLAKVNSSQEEIFRSELSDQEIKNLMQTKYIPMHEIIPYVDAELGGDVKKSIFVIKGGMGSGRRRLGATSVFTPDRQAVLNKQKEDYEAKKKLEAGRVDKYYTDSMGGNKKEDPKPVVKEKKSPTSTIQSRPGASSTHKDYLKRIGAIKSFVVKKDKKQNLIIKADKKIKLVIEED